MTNWKYTDATNSVVFRTLEDGRMESMLATADTYLAWLAEGNTPEPADPPVVDIRAQIDQLERESLLPRVTREFMLLSFATTAAGMGVDPTTNVAYVKVKELDERIAALRSQL